MEVRHFLKLRDLSKEEIQNLFQRAIELKINFRQGKEHQSLRGRTLAMIFEKSSTRTRVSFEAGMAQLGGSALFLSPKDTQLGRGEPIEDTARVISRMVDLVMIRTFEHDKLERFARNSRVPVINGLTDSFHPCQLLADMLTYQEARGSIEGKVVAFLGDGRNNMANSWIEAAKLMDFSLHLAGPKDYLPDQSVVGLEEQVKLFEDAHAAVAQADLVVTDVWASMGQEEETAARHARLAPYQVNEALMAEAKDDAVFMHCLPAHRGEEVAAEVIDGPMSLVWDEAENRLHVQKALMEFLMKATPDSLGLA